MKRLLKTEKSRKILTIISLFLIALFIAEMSPQSLFHHGMTDIDQSVFQHVANVIKDGGMPYKDTFDHKGPLIYIIYALGSSIPAMHGVWLFEFIAVLITIIFLYKIARLAECNRPAAVIATIVAVTPWIGTFYDSAMTEEFALPFCAISLYVFLDFLINDKLTATRSLLCGFCLGGVLMLRPNMISVWVVFSIAAAITYIKQKRIKEMLKTVSLFSLGILIFITPILVWLVIGSAFGDFIDQYFIFNIEYSKIPEHSSLIDTTLIYAVPIFILAFFSSIPINKKDRTLVRRSIFIYLVLTLLLCILPRRWYPHYGMLLTVAMIYPVAASIQIFQKYRNQPAVVQTLFAVLLSLISLTWFNSARNIMKTSSINKTLDPLTSYVVENTDDGDYIAVLGNYDYIYNSTRRKSASRYSYTTPERIRPSIQEEYLNDWKNIQPKLIIMVKTPNEKIKEFIKDNGYQFEKNIFDSVQIYSKY